ncbi:helix-turn-helix domain-containing protein [Candidatus Uabimicrobium sp. HlEnr_7]|uniref:helix-turn-helix domain-containing protein n=1 Tax=Candidatus Uabimicrobium helgolandensis TaxID=3095367 RepID=UPI003558EF6B
MHEEQEKLNVQQVLEELKRSTNEIQKSNLLLQKICDSFRQQLNEQHKEFLSTKEAGEMISKTKYTILRWIKAGQIDAVCINRRYFINRSSLSRFIQHSK